MTVTLPPFHGYQDKAIEFALDRPGCNIFARPGKGKTRSALEIIEATGVRTLVLAPKFPALTVWKPENEKWGYNFDMRVLHGKEKKMGTEDVSVINYDGMEWLRHQDLSSYEMIVYDEVSKMKNPGTNRFKRWRKLMKTFEFKVGLTGTPMGNKLLDLWGEMYVVDHGETLGRTLSGRDGYKERYFYPHPHVRHVWLPQSGARDAIFEAIKPNAIALDYFDDEMPELTFNPIYLEMPAAARKVYEDMRKDSTVDGTELFAVNAGVRSQKLRQMAAGRVYDNNGAIIKMHKKKQTALQNLVEELQGDPLLVFYEFSHDLDSIKEIVGDVPALNGNTKSSDMIDIVKRWNNGELEVLPCHPKTAGMGGNMQESGHNVCFYSMPWSLEDLEQGIDRIWRQGQKAQGVIVHLLMLRDTKDEDIYHDKQVKKADQDELFKRLTR